MCLLSSDGKCGKIAWKTQLQCMLNVYKSCPLQGRFCVEAIWCRGTGQPGKSFVGVISDTHGLKSCSALLAGLSASFMPETLAAPQC